jgi:hypothetical protein
MYGVAWNIATYDSYTGAGGRTAGFSRINGTGSWERKVYLVHSRSTPEREYHKLAWRYEYISPRDHGPDDDRMLDPIIEVEKTIYNLPFPANLDITQLGQTAIRTSYVQTTAEGYQPVFRIQSRIVSDLAPGSASSFNSRNKGLGQEILAHERGHAAQIEDAIRNSIFSILFKGVSYSGTIKDIFFQAEQNRMNLDEMNNMIIPFDRLVLERVEAIENFEDRATLIGSKILKLKRLDYFNGFRQVRWD